MEGGGSILESILDDDNIEDFEDVEMLDIEEGECIEESSHKVQGQSSGEHGNVIHRETQSKNRKRKNKRKNKKRNGGPAPHATDIDIDRFVRQTCKLLQEKKSYMVYTAVGCLGVSALSDFIKEVDAIQACGGQMTADGRRHRTGGGILWSIIKAREPKVHKEIMKRATEFERQFRRPNIIQIPEQNKGASQETNHVFSDQTTGVSDSAELIPQIQLHSGNPNGEEHRQSVHNRIRVPVSYDDILGEDPKDEAI